MVLVVGSFVLGFSNLKFTNEVEENTNGQENGEKYFVDNPFPSKIVFAFTEKF